MSKEDKHTPSLSIGSVAQKLGVSVETIRLYERRGLILITKTEGNQRLYSESDIERLQCIRTAINEQKISIEGIRRIQSFVPCWRHIHCSTDQRANCPAYQRSDAGCWTYKDKMNDCTDRECRDCPVYQLSGDCDKIKTLIYQVDTPLSKTARPQGK